MQCLRYHILPCMRQGMLTLSGSSSVTSHSDIYILSMGNLYISNAYIYIHSISNLTVPAVTVSEHRWRQSLDL